MLMPFQEDHVRNVRGGKQKSKETLRSAADQGEETDNCLLLQEVKICRSLGGPTTKELEEEKTN